MATVHCAVCCACANCALLTVEHSTHCAGRPRKKKKDLQKPEHSGKAGYCRRRCCLLPSYTFGRQCSEQQQQTESCTLNAVQHSRWWWRWWQWRRPVSYRQSPVSVPPSHGRCIQAQASMIVVFFSAILSLFLFSFWPHICL